MIWKIAVFVWLGIEVWLSHENGEKSGEESAWLARRTGIKEGLLRRAAHFTLFAVLGLLTGFGFGWYGVGFAALWAVVAEATKRGVEGRHCLAVDMLLNLSGVVLGMLVWILMR